MPELLFFSRNMGRNVYTNKRCTGSVWAEASKTTGAVSAMGSHRRPSGLTSGLGQRHISGLIKPTLLFMFGKFARLQSFRPTLICLLVQCARPCARRLNLA